MKNLIKYFLACGLLTFGNACTHDDLEVFKPSENYSNLVDFAANNYDLSLFAAGLEYTGLADTLRTAAGPFTVFAPSNTAFNALGVTQAADFALLNRDSLKMMLRYHILPRRLYTADVPDKTADNFYTNLAGLPLGVDLKLGSTEPGTYFYAGGARVSRRDVVVSNGVLHLLEKAIKYSTGKVTDVLESRPEYSLFTAALKRFGYWPQLQEGSQWTVMAVPNSVFATNNITLQDIEAMNPAEYHKRFLGCYLFRAKIPWSHLRVLEAPQGSGQYYYNSAYFRIPIEGDEEYCSGVGKSELKFFISRTNPGTSTPQALGDFGPAFKLDYLCTNGVVHDMNILLVKPSQAKK